MMKSLIPVVMAGIIGKNFVILQTTNILLCYTTLLYSKQTYSNTLTLLGVYGLVVSVLIANDLNPTRDYSLYAGFIHMAAGLATGLTGVSAGYAIGVSLFIT